MEFSQCLIFELFIYLFVYVSLMKSCRSRMLLGPRGRQARAELRPVRLPVTSPTLPHSRSQPAPSFLPSFPPSRPGANARSRERLGEAPPGQSGGLSAGAPRSRAPPGADLELRRPAWKLTRSFLPSPSIQARSEGRPPTPHPHTRLCSGGELRGSPVWRALSRHTHGGKTRWLAGWLAGWRWSRLSPSQGQAGRRAGGRALGPRFPSVPRSLSLGGQAHTQRGNAARARGASLPPRTELSPRSLARSLARGRPWRFVHTPGRVRSPLPGGPGSPRSERGRQARAELRQVTPHPPPPEIHTRKRRVMISSGDD